VKAAGIEPVTFRFVTQHLNHLLQITYLTQNTCNVYLFFVCEIQGIQLLDFVFLYFFLEHVKMEKRLLSIQTVYWTVPIRFLCLCLQVSLCCL